MNSETGGYFYAWQDFFHKISLWTGLGVKSRGFVEGEVYLESAFRLQSGLYFYL